MNELAPEMKTLPDNSSMDCSKPAPTEYTWMLHSSIFVSVPCYAFAIIALFRIKSTHFVTYKHFLIWHTLINFVAEIYNSWFLIPVVHLPHPLLRMTGIMTYFGFSGLFQFYVVNGLIYQTAYSILEMFMFRFRAGFISYEASYLYKFLHLIIWLFRFILVLFVIIGIFTFQDAIIRQHIYKKEIVMANPEAPPEVMCYSVVVALPFTDLICLAHMAIWFFVILLTFIVTSTTTIFLNKYLRDNDNHSEAVLRMQKMLLVSLFVQTAIHGIMLGVPNLLFLYAAFFGAHHEIIANIAFSCLTFHGFFSTLAMIIFTKPIQVAILRLCKCGAPSTKVVHYTENTT